MAESLTKQQTTAQSDATTTTYGKLTLANGEYEGQIKNGLVHGQGTVYYWNGDKYIGSFLYGRESGKGMITQMIDGKLVTQEIDYPIPTAVPTTPCRVAYQATKSFTIQCPILNLLFEERE